MSYQKVVNHLSLTLVILLLATPHMMHAGTSPLALLILEIMGLALLLILFSGNIKIFNINHLTWFGLLAGLSIPIIYLIPLPLSIWEQLPGRNNFLPSINWLIEKGEPVPWLSLSLIPQNTVHALLAIIPILAIFLGTVYQNKKGLLWIAYALIIIASVQATIGFIQYPVTSHAQGTYINTNHFAAFMYMVLPFTFALLTYAIGSKASNYEGGGYSYFNSTFLFGLISILLILSGIFSTSRTGGFLIFSAVIISIVVFFRHIGGRQGMGLSTLLGILGLGAATSIGLIPVINRFVTLNPAESLRWEIFPDMITGVQKYFPIGSGPGTFQEIFITFQSMGIDREGFVNRAHNDYLELLLETGIIGVIFTVLAFFIFIQGWLSLRKQPWNKIKFLNSAAGIAVSLMLVHALLDFNFHNPANALAFACIFGIFLNQEKS